MLFSYAVLHAVHLATEILLLDGSTLVVFLLTTGKSYQKLGIAVISDIQSDSNYCQSLFLDCTLEFI